MKNKLYTEPFEHYKSEPKDNSNLYVGIAVGVMITLCGMIYVGVSYLEAVMY
jgi:hypothetical protein